MNYTDLELNLKVHLTKKNQESPFITFIDVPTASIINGFQVNRFSVLSLVQGKVVNFVHNRSDK